MPKNVRIEKPIQIVWLIDEPGTAQWAHTLAVVGEFGECRLREYCLAPDVEGQALHAGGFELYAHPGAQVDLAHYQDWGPARCTTSRPSAWRSAATPASSGCRSTSAAT